MRGSWPLEAEAGCLLSPTPRSLPLLSGRQVVTFCGLSATRGSDQISDLGQSLQQQNSAQEIMGF